MADRERNRVEIAFKSGQTLGVSLTSEAIDELDRALLKGEPESLTFDAEDGRYTVVIKMITFVKRHARESRVGFGAGG